MPKYKYVFFDLDGTLTDSAEGITNSVEYALKQFGITAQNKKDLNRFVGPPLLDAFAEYYGFDEKDAALAVKYYRERFKDKGIFENALYHGVKELLSKLKEKNYKLVIATSKPEEYAKRIAEHFDIAKYFIYVAGATFDASRTTKIQVIEYALKELNITEKRQVVMIGDRHHDAEGARDAGIDFIGVLYGYGSRSELEKYENRGLVQVPSEIEDLL